MEDLRSNDIADSEVVGRDKDIRSLTNASEKTVSSVMEGISEEEATLWIQEQFEILGKQMMEKYPEIARVTELTPDEFHELYSTDEAKDAIRELALQAKNEFFADFESSSSFYLVMSANQCLMKRGYSLQKTGGTNVRHDYHSDSHRVGNVTCVFSV